MVAMVALLVVIVRVVISVAVALVGVHRQVDVVDGQSSLVGPAPAGVRLSLVAHAGRVQRRSESVATYHFEQILRAR